MHIKTIVLISVVSVI